MSTQHDLAGSRTTGEWQEADSRHYLHPFTDFKQLAAHGARIITSANGVYLNDLDGNRILDAMAGLWCVNVGYGRRELAEAAYQQMLELPYYNSFFKSAHPPAIELARLLAEVTPSQFSRVFYAGSGSEANGGEFHHGYTYSGHPVACAVAIRNIRILQEEGIVERVRTDTGPYLQRRWRELAEHPLVGEARGIGFIGALELVDEKSTRRFFPNRGAVGTICRDHCSANGLVMRAVRDTMIISPPLVMERAHIDELVEKVWRCLDLTARDITKT